MADTGAPFALTYQALTDPPNGAGLGEELAADVHTWLSRALVVADQTARDALPGAILTPGLVVFRTDLQAYEGRTASGWVGLSGSGGGGGGDGSVSRGRWAASSAQSIPNDDDTTVLFGSNLASTPDIVKATDGPGSKFTLQRAGVLSGALVLRYATTSADGVRDVHVTATYGSTTEYLGSSGGAVKGQPRTHSVAILPTDLPDDAVIRVECYQGTGGTRQLEPSTGGRWVRLALELR